MSGVSQSWLTTQHFKSDTAPSSGICVVDEDFKLGALEEEELVALNVQQLEYRSACVHPKALYYQYTTVQTMARNDHVQVKQCIVVKTPRLVVASTAISWHGHSYQARPTKTGFPYIRSCPSP